MRILSLCAPEPECVLQAGVSRCVYHGCPKCNKHIWEEKDDGNHCPVEGCNGTRRDENVNNTRYQRMQMHLIASVCVRLQGVPHQEVRFKGDPRSPTFMNFH